MGILNFLVACSLNFIVKVSLLGGILISSLGEVLRTRRVVKLSNLGLEERSVELSLRVTLSSELLTLSSSFLVSLSLFFRGVLGLKLVEGEESVFKEPVRGLNSFSFLILR